MTSWTFGTARSLMTNDDDQQTLRNVFPSSNAFKDAIRDDVDDALVDGGWCKCTMDVDGVSVTSYLCSGLDVMLGALCDAKDVRFWSGESGPAPPTAMRETAFEGEAFRKNEEDVFRRHGPNSFFLGINVYSDACHISTS